MPIKRQVFSAISPIRPLIRQFHRLATVLLLIMAALSITVWFLTRVIYPEPEMHLDDLSDYEAFLPGSTAKPNVNVFRMATESFWPVKTASDNIENITYTNAHTSYLTIVHTSDPHGNALQFILYSNNFRLLDMLLRWGRPDDKRKDVLEGHWDLVWRTDHYSVSGFCRHLNLDAPAPMITITFN